MPNTDKLTAKEFAVILGNNEFQKSFPNDLATSIDRILENYNNRQHWGVINIKFIKTIAMTSNVLKMGTSSFVFANDLSDSIQEVMPNHGIVAVPWTVYVA